MSNIIAPGSSVDVNVKVTALTTNPNVPVTYKTIILKKNLVNGVNTLTQEMMSITNTKYVIKYNYTLGEDITIPANCVLEFDGGSVSGEFTLIGTNTKIVETSNTIFGNGLILDGTFLLTDILANWFSGSTDDVMFQRAFDFAYKVYQNMNTSYSYTNPNVICLRKVYTIYNPIIIQNCVSFDGKGACFYPTSNLINKYMFNCNVADNGCIVEYSNSNMVQFCNVSFENPDSLLVHFIHCADARYFHHLYAFRPARLIFYTGNYIDGRKISDVTCEGENLNYTLNPNDYGNTCRVNIGLGDDTHISNLNDGVSILIGNNGNVEIDSCINLDVYVVETDNVFIRNLHNENGIIRCARSRIVIKDSYFYAKQNGNIIGISENNEYPSVYMENCTFYYLSSLQDIHSYLPIKNFINGDIYNTYGVLENDNSGGNMKLILKYNANYYINPEHFSFCYNAPLIDNFSITSLLGSEIWLPESTNDANPVAYYRIIFLLDTKRNIAMIDVLNKWNREFSFAASHSLNFYNNRSIMNLKGAFLRIEAGTKSGVYTHYLDIGCVLQTKNTILLKYENSTFSANGIPFKTIDYTQEYCIALAYNRKATNIDAIINGSALPNVLMFNNYDKITLSETSKIYNKLNNSWVQMN